MVFRLPTLKRHFIKRGFNQSPKLNPTEGAPAASFCLSWVLSFFSLLVVFSFFFFSLVLSLVSSFSFFFFSAVFSFLSLSPHGNDSRKDKNSLGNGGGVK